MSAAQMSDLRDKIELWTRDQVCVPVGGAEIPAFKDRVEIERRKDEEQSAYTEQCALVEKMYRIVSKLAKSGLTNLGIARQTLATETCVS